MTQKSAGAISWINATVDVQKSWESCSLFRTKMQTTRSRKTPRHKGGNKRLRPSSNWKQWDYVKPSVYIRIETQAVIDNKY